MLSKNISRRRVLQTGAAACRGSNCPTDESPAPAPTTLALQR